MFLTIKSWKGRFNRWVAEEQFHQHEDKLFLALTLLIGAVVGLVIAAFILLTENLGSQMYPAGGSPWRRLLIPTLGSLVTGILLFRYFPGARGSGIPQTKAALFLQDGVILFRTVLGRFGLSSISLASGIALGREGPSVQVGSGIASVLGRWLGFSPSRVKALIPIGASAALAAAFNTPIAAVLFTLEEVMGDMHAPVLGSIVLSSATSWVVLHLVLGDEPLFHVPSYQLVHPAEFLAYAALGVLGGLVSVAFVKLLLYIRERFRAFPKSTVWLQPVAGGLLVGLLGWFFPDVLGVGYAHVSQALNGQFAITAMALLVVLKIVATSTCYASGNAGGIFGPSLFIGAMLGGAVGGGVHALFPAYTGGAGAYALVGMGTAFAGIIRTPMTSVIMIFEVTRDYSIIVPLMISNLISYYISYRMQPEAIYEALQHQEGIHLPPSAGVRESVMLVHEVTWSALEPLIPSTRLADALARMSEEVDALPVVDNGVLLTLLTRTQVQSAIDQGQGIEPIAAILPLNRHHRYSKGLTFPSVYPDDALDTALRRMADAGIHVLPVIGRGNIRGLTGLITLSGILEGYWLGGKKESLSESPARPAGATRGLVIGLASSAIALMTVIGFLNYHYRAARRDRARSEYAAGTELLRQGRPADSVEQYRNALSAFPANSDYRLALGMALIDAGNPTEAEVFLSQLLKGNPNDGRANLGMGRSAARQGKTKDAEDYYHRAIYGTWPSNAPKERLSARFELVDYLVQIGANTQAVSELLAVPGQAPNDLTALERAGDLLLKFGSAKQAADVFRDILRQDSRNWRAYESLGLAQISMGDYQAALAPLRDAVKWNPDDDTARTRLVVAEDVVALNPSARGLSNRERYQRSEQILQRAVGDLESCVSVDRSSSELKSAHELLSTARQILARRSPQVSGSDSVDKNVSLAKQLQDERKTLCSLGGGQDDALDQALSLYARQ